MLKTNFLNVHANALTDLADVLELAGGPNKRRRAVQSALALYVKRLWEDLSSRTGRTNRRDAKCLGSAGAGTEPGASRSRNLGGLAHRSLFRGY
jgi:hypothetical protein